jgi:hypothetical protein
MVLLPPASVLSFAAWATAQLPFVVPRRLTRDSSDSALDRGLRPHHQYPRILLWKYVGVCVVRSGWCCLELTACVLRKTRPLKQFAFSVSPTMTRRQLPGTLDGRAG